MARSVFWAKKHKKRTGKVTIKGRKGTSSEAWEQYACVRSHLYIRDVKIVCVYLSNGKEARKLMIHRGASSCCPSRRVVIMVFQCVDAWTANFILWQTVSLVNYPCIKESFSCGSCTFLIHKEAIKAADVVKGAMNLISRYFEGLGMD